MRKKILLSINREHNFFSPLTFLTTLVLLISICSAVFASTNKEVVSYTQSSNIGNTGNYQWWYGCAPTAAGMMIGYYDRNGYMGYSYDNLVPGGIAEAGTFGNPAALVNSVIASAGHISDFYSGGYGTSGDDTVTHSFNCLADFMGSNQDSAGNANGSTKFWYYADGSAFHDFDDESYGLTESDGMYGIGEYIKYAGYSTEALYNQYIDAMNLTYGFTYSQYMAEIDAGRPVLIQVTNHTMLGYGYFTNEGGQNCIYLYDTFSPNGQNPGNMVWGGTYQYGDILLQQYGVTVMELTVVPAPGAILLCCTGAGLVGLMQRRRSVYKFL